MSESIIKLKTPEEIKTLRVGGQKLARILKAVSEHIKPGVKASELNDIAHKMMIESGGKPAFLGYTPYGANRPYPASLCVSINDEIVHGIPNEEEKVIKDGDLVTIDGGFIYEGLYTDHAITIMVGEVSKEARNLVTRTKEALNAGIKKCQVGNKIGDISAAIEKVAIDSGLYVVDGLAGHGVGYGVHEEPYVPNDGDPGVGEELKPGLVIAIEPMFSTGTSEIVSADDGYTYLTADESLSAQWEHTVAITEDGPVILTDL